MLSVTSIYSLPASYKLYQNHNLILSILIFAIYISTVFIEYNTNLGFSALSQENVEKHSASATLADSLKTQATEQLDALAVYSALNLGDLSRQQRSLTDKLMVLRQRLSSCPSGFTKHCINPTEIKIKEVESSLFNIKLDIGNANKYNHALNKKVTLSSNISNKQSIDIHPLFNIQSRLVGSTPKETQAQFLAFSSFISTILASILFLTSSALKQSITVDVLPTKKRQGMVITQWINKSLLQRNDKSVRHEACTVPELRHGDDTEKNDEPFGRSVCDFTGCNAEFVRSSQGNRFCCDDHRVRYHSDKRRELKNSEVG